MCPFPGRCVKLETRQGESKIAQTLGGASVVSVPWQLEKVWLQADEELAPGVSRPNSVSKKAARCAKPRCRASHHTDGGISNISANVSCCVTWGSGAGKAPMASLGSNGTSLFA